MSDAQQQAQQSDMTMGKAVGIYVAFLIGFGVIGMLTMSFQSFPGVVAFFVYVAFGIILNRMVLRGLVEWHPVYNTVENVSSSKLRMLALWPVTYPVLFFKLGVVKHL